MGQGRSQAELEAELGRLRERIKTLEAAVEANLLARTTSTQHWDQLRRVLDVLPHYVFAKDPTGRFTFVNQRLAESFELRAEDMVGRHDSEFEPWASDSGRLREDDREVIETGRPKFVSAEPFVDRQGVTRYFESRKIPLPDPEAGEVGVLVLATEVSEAVAREREQRRLLTAMDQAGEAIAVLDRRGNVLYANAALGTMLKRPVSQLVGRPLEVLTSGEGDRALMRQMQERLITGETWRGRYTTLWDDGSRYIRDATVVPVRDEAGRVVNYVGVVRDVTREAQLEQELLQAQKMEAVGQLAGGVAHDFNNLLTVISGHGEQLLDDMPDQDRRRADAEQILEAADRAASLTRQLLVFSRRRSLQTRVLDLNRKVKELDPMLSRLIGEDVEFRYELAEHPLAIEVDPSQVEQVIVNLVVNARDAMDRGGTITIRTAEGADPETVARLDLPAGEYVLLQVSDTGMGMDEETRRHAFEPFFTTKELGKGTGLGLSTVYAIAQQSGGGATVASEPGRGATFEVLFPRVDRIVESEEEPPPRPLQGLVRHETILVVEDESAIRRLVVETLARKGYEVLEASNGREALELASRYDAPIDLLVTDVVMPEMSGPELCQHLQRERPGCRVLFMTGYANDSFPGATRLDPTDSLLEKPFRPRALIQHVREVLERSASLGD
ncbi:MAG: PAS domain-containing protein [Proteobacteria bacterium]|nr:PAS domain-containing protein [Pseudomonadota bacterium]